MAKTGLIICLPAKQWGSGCVFTEVTVVHVCQTVLWLQSAETHLPWSQPLTLQTARLLRGRCSSLCTIYSDSCCCLTIRNCWTIKSAHSRKTFLFFCFRVITPDKFLSSHMSIQHMLMIMFKVVFWCHFNQKVNAF